MRMPFFPPYPPTRLPASPLTRLPAYPLTRLQVTKSGRGDAADAWNDWLQGPEIEPVLVRQDLHFHVGERDGLFAAHLCRVGVTAPAIEHHHHTPAEHHHSAVGPDLDRSILVDTNSERR